MARPPHTKLAALRARELRNEMTVSEASLWSGIRGARTGGRFRRQVPMGRWIVDFACFDPKIVIEVDDKSHDYRDERERSAFIESLGFRILRFDNIDVAQQIDAIVRFITAEVKRVASYPERES